MSAAAHVCLAAQPRTAHGTPDAMISRGATALLTVTADLAGAIVKAVKGKTTAAAIRSAIDGAAKRYGHQPLAKPIVRELLHGSMLGALDASTEADTGRPVAVERFRAADRGTGFAARPLADAIKSFLQKKAVTREVFDAMEEDAQRRAFTVARAANAEMVKTVKQELLRQLAVGADLSDFGKHAAERFKSAGWVPANGSHVETVFRTNVMNAYNGGRVRQMTQPEVIAARPYWEWLGVGDGPPRQRPSHAKMHGVVLAASDPFWQKCCPPAGYNCRCRLRSLSEKQGKGRVQSGSGITGLPDPGFTSGMAELFPAGSPPPVDPNPKPANDPPPPQRPANDPPPVPRPANEGGSRPPPAPAPRAPLPAPPAPRPAPPRRAPRRRPTPVPVPVPRAPRPAPPPRRPRVPVPPPVAAPVPPVAAPPAAPPAPPPKKPRAPRKPPAPKAPAKSQPMATHEQLAAHMKARGADRVPEDVYTKVRSTMGRDLTPAEFDTIIGHDAFAGLPGARELKVRVSFDGVRFENLITPPGGLPSVRLVRSFRRYEDGRLMVHHDLLRLSEKLQGSGVGARVIKAQLATYESLGVTAIDLDAAWVGRYYWPKLGFDVDPGELRVYIDKFSDYLGSIGYSGKAVLNFTKDIKSMRDIAISREGSTQLGKDFLLGELMDPTKGQHSERHEAAVGEMVPFLRMAVKPGDPVYENMKREVSK